MGNNNDKYRKFLSYFDFLGYDNLGENLLEIMEKRWMFKKSYLFDNDLYNSFRRILMPPKHLREQGKEIFYTSEQQKFIDSKEDIRTKVRGFAGSGKTLCLAKRAVNAYLRHGQPVLILTYNIALRNYIHDKLNEVRENFEWSNFHIIHYYEFFINQANNFNIEINDVSDWDNDFFFDNASGNIRKYDTIIIDEIQDYKKSWIKILNRFFLEEKGEYLVFGDEKQNIYHRELEEKKPYTQIPGQWNELKSSFRLTNDIAQLAYLFQRKFFLDIYEIDPFEQLYFQKDMFDEEESLIKYYNIIESESTILEIYQNTVEKHNVHQNDICIQSSRIKILRELDFLIRTKLNFRTKTTFETKEMFEYIKKNTQEEKIKEEINQIRKNKKFHFWNNSGCLKLSTIHSFKGWEVNTLFLIINAYDDDQDDELIYTAITRCRANLIIINLGNKKYHDFFSHCDLVEKEDI